MATDGGGGGGCGYGGGGGGGGGGLQVIVDIDDTVKSSGGVCLGNIPLGGVDTQFQRGDFYPGVFRFVLALAVGTGGGGGGGGEDEGGSRKGEGGAPAVAPADGDGTWPETPGGASAAEGGGSGAAAAGGGYAVVHPVAVLTARAQEFLWALQLKDTDPVCRAFTACGAVHGGGRGVPPGWGIGSRHVMYGSVREWVLSDLKGWRKFENFKLLRKTHPPGREPSGYVFVGDTGELDKEAGMRMLTDKATRGVVLAVFLHVVSFDLDPEVPPDCFINGRPIVYFRTYIGAALKAAEHGLMAPQEMRHVALQACADLASGSGRKGSASREAALLVGGAAAATAATATATAFAAAAASSDAGGSGGRGGVGLAEDPLLGSKWRDLAKDLREARRKYPKVLGDLTEEALAPPALLAAAKARAKAKAQAPAANGRAPR